ncbi:hypothetical protein HOLleu_05055 [Holothuria leucospilota]|uniref:Uncharacterized protein n=1 Tax=Holothuria leucospilota TaxID=206669 RepID=A0A9Q1CL15_HOLLE|nr:hypothetical protein HOLleu_05055 [Holothuria leucospilota]
MTVFIESLTPEDSTDHCKCVGTDGIAPSMGAQLNFPGFTVKAGSTPEAVMPGSCTSLAAPCCALPRRDTFQENTSRWLCQRQYCSM